MERIGEELRGFGGIGGYWVDKKEIHQSLRVFEKFMGVGWIERGWMLRKDEGGWEWMGVDE